MHVFKHPKYYTELRKRNRVARNPMGGYSQSDQAISKEPATAGNQRSPGSGLKQQAASAKLQAPSDSNNKPQASSPKQQASSCKPQATSSLIMDPWKSFMAPEPRCSTKINVLLGCFK